MSPSFKAVSIVWALVCIAFWAGAFYYGRDALAEFSEAFQAGLESELEEDTANEWDLDGAWIDWDDAPEPPSEAALISEIVERCPAREGPEALTGVWRDFPLYPTGAARDGVEGYALVGFSVLEDGSTAGVEVVDSDPPEVFDAMAVLAVGQWRFCPRDEPREGEFAELTFFLED